MFSSPGVSVRLETNACPALQAGHGASLAVGGQTLVAVHVGRDAVAAREISDRLLEVRVIGSKLRICIWTGHEVVFNNTPAVHQDVHH